MKKMLEEEDDDDLEEDYEGEEEDFEDEEEDYDSDESSDVQQPQVDFNNNLLILSLLPNFFQFFQFSSSNLTFFPFS